MAKSRFAIDIAQFGKTAIKRSRFVARHVVLDITRRLIKHGFSGSTPVGNPSLWKGGDKSAPPGYVGGRLRGNWQTSVGRPAQGELDIRDPAAAEGEATLAMGAWDGEGSAFIVNNLPYAAVIERGDHSTQAPQGMVKVTMAETPGIVEKQRKRAQGIK